jgi:hypothetical protein
MGQWLKGKGGWLGLIMGREGRREVFLLSIWLRKSRINSKRIW